MNKTSVVVTGLAWMGTGIGSIESALEHLFTSAEQEIALTVYALGTNPEQVTRWLEGALSRGLLVRMIINRSEEQPTVTINRLKELASRYPHFQLFSFEGPEKGELHAKVIVTDRNLALVGSSNLSWHGMIANHELALQVEGKAAAEVASALDKLFHSTFCVRIEP
ncbi:MAG TPA: phospholipase D-like domain-containing protein [Anaerolineae bacterium]|nr:phospholipase D-like domain-containing protein [Anaerolineae bacterium]HQJ11194.1 phospholipase D-like domain-containing protein [Anaerolineae bacterium]